MKKYDKVPYKNVKLLLALPVILMFVGCESTSITESELQNQSPINTDSLQLNEVLDLVYGKWNWSHSIIMSRNLQPPDNNITPFSEGFTLHREFKNTHKVDNYVNGLFEDTQAFDVDRNRDSITVIQIDSSHYHLRFIHSNMMMIGTGFMCGVDEFYLRIE